MLSSAKVIAFLPSTDLERSRDFFTATLGMTVDEVTPYACVLHIGDTMVRVTKVDDLHPQPFTVFGWEVTDIEGVMTPLAEAGVSFLHFAGMDQDGAGVWTTPGGDKVAWFQDPDGNTLSLTQFGHSGR
jgi:catechol 2,3-dioxygenase-like lactoylglutathione lyase family enzyme